MWFDKLTTLRKLEGRIISFIDQPDVIKKILEHLGLWEESQAPFDPSYGWTVRVPHGPEEDRRVNSPSPRKIEGLPAHLILSYPGRSGEVQPCAS
jgi:hypothetical protein